MIRASTARARMRGRDLLLRGRGADVGVRAPDLVVRIIGAMAGVAIAGIADSLGLTAVLGVGETWIWLWAAVAGAAIATTSFGSILWWMLGAVIGLHTLVGFTPLVRPFVATFVRSDPPIAESQAIIVLSGGMNDDGRLRKQALDRLLTGLRIVLERRTPHLALSVTQSEVGGRLVTTEDDQRALVTLIAPAVDLRIVHDVFSTRDEALAFAALARTHGWTTVTLVTSPMHTSRACATFESTGLRIECRPAEPRDYSLDRLDRPGNRRLAFADAVYESIAWLLYRARGWS